MLYKEVTRYSEILADTLYSINSDKLMNTIKSYKSTHISFLQVHRGSKIAHAFLETAHNFNSHARV